MSTSRLPSNLVTWYPGGFAWPAYDDRCGRYVMCPVKSSEPLGLGVVDDFGDLVRVPSVGEFSAYPTSGVLT